MPEQLIFTSAPRGLKAGSGGYCTVAQSRNLRDGLILPLEQLSYYSHLALPGQESLAKNPIICAYRKLTLTGTEYRILTRIVDAGADHTGRSNYLAHHLIFENDWRNIPSPAVIFKSWQGWHKTWSHPAGYIEEDPTDELKALNAGKPYSPEFLEYGWQHTFTSFLQAKDAQSQFDWIGVRNDPNTCGDILREANQPLIQLQGPAELQGDWLLTFKNPGRNGIEAPDNDENKLIDLYEHAQQQAICHAQDAAFKKANQKIDEAEKNLNYQYQIIKQVHQSVTNTITDFNTEHDHLTDEGGRKARLNQNTKSDLKAPLEKATIGYKNAEALSGQTSSKIADAKTRLARQELIELDLSQEIQQLKAFGRILDEQKSIIDNIISDFLSELEAMKPVKPVLAKRTPYQAPQASVQNQEIKIPNTLRKNAMAPGINDPASQREEYLRDAPQAEGSNLSKYVVIAICIVAALLFARPLINRGNNDIILSSKKIDNAQVLLAKTQKAGPDKEATFYLIVDRDGKYKPTGGDTNLINTLISHYRKDSNTMALVGFNKKATHDPSTGVTITNYLVYNNNPDKEKPYSDHGKKWSSELLPFRKSREKEIFQALNYIRFEHALDMRKELCDEQDINAFSASLESWRAETNAVMKVIDINQELLTRTERELKDLSEDEEKALTVLIVENYDKHVEEINTADNNEKFNEIQINYNRSIEGLTNHLEFSTIVSELITSEKGEYNIAKAIEAKQAKLDEQAEIQAKNAEIIRLREELEKKLTSIIQSAFDEFSSKSINIQYDLLHKDFTNEYKPVKDLSKIDFDHMRKSELTAWNQSDLLISYKHVKFLSNNNSLSDLKDRETRKNLFSYMKLRRSPIKVTYKIEIYFNFTDRNFGRYEYKPIVKDLKIK